MKDATQLPGIQFKSEAQLQAAFWKYTWNNYPQLRSHMWSVPNDAIGQLTSVKDVLRINELKSTGLLPGVWDLHCFWNGKFHVIESKLPGKPLTIDRVVKGRKTYGQKEWGELMAAHGAIRHIYHTLEEGILIIEEILKDVETK